MLVQSDDAVAEGLCLPDLSAEDIARLDAYEQPFGFDPAEISITVGDAVQTARCYLPDDTVGRGTAPWSLAAWDAAIGPLSRERAREIGSYTPPLTGDALRAQWHMMTLRAGVRLRAQADTTPATRRYSPSEGDVVTEPRAPLAGDFFKFAAFRMDHRTFHGDRTGLLDRETIIACDAAIVLPYDPRSDCVLLVEQMRVGPLIRGDKNPWVLEPVAGMIDGTETPEQAAIRETEEEAGLTNITLEKMFSFYASPGASTDYFNCFMALADLPEPTQYTGGLANEHEDLRLHVLLFNDAMALIDTGEANVGPLIAMLYWLARHRDRLRAAA